VGAPHCADAQVATVIVLRHRPGQVLALKLALVRVEYFSVRGELPLPGRGGGRQHRHRRDGDSDHQTDDPDIGAGGRRHSGGEGVGRERRVVDEGDLALTLGRGRLAVGGR